MRKEKYISVQQRKAGTAYVVKIPYYIDGERKVYEKAFSVAKYGESAKALAVYHRNEKIAEFQSGNVPQTVPTVRQLYDRSHVLFPCRATTKKRHDYYFRHGIQKYSNYPIDQIKASDVQISLNEYAENHTHALTSKLLALWRQIFKAAQLDGIRVTDKTIGVTVPKDLAPPKKRSATISDEDFWRFMESLSNYHCYDEDGTKVSETYWNVLLVMYYTGMRPAEVFALRKQSCDLVKGLIYVTNSIGVNSHGERCLMPVKTANAVRSVPIHPDLLPYLTEAYNQASDFLFLVHGEFISIDHFSNTIHLVSKKCGIEFRSYMLRHKFATDLQKTQPPRTVQDLLGHASFDMSLEYARSTEDERKEAILNRFS